MPENTDPPSASHWGTHDPASEPDRNLVIGIGRMVAECRARLGDCTPEGVLADLRARGLEVTDEQVRHFWDAG